MRNVLVVGAAVAAAAIGEGAFAQEIQVVVDGNQVMFHRQGPKMVGDRVLVPLRGVFEDMGATVDWHAGSETIVARRQGNVVRLGIGRNSATVDGKQVDLDVPAQIVHGSTMVPLRFIGEALGKTVHWDASSETVTISGGSYNMPKRRIQSGDHSRPLELADSKDSFSAGTVIPVSFAQILNSDEIRKGQRFSAFVGQYPGVPEGSRLEGFVEDVSPSQTSQTGAIEIAFDSLVTPDGTRFQIDGQPVPLDAPGVEKRPSGRMVASHDLDDSRYVFAEERGHPKLVRVPGVGALHNEETMLEVAKMAPTNGGSGGHAAKLIPGTKFGVRLVSAAKKL